MTGLYINQQGKLVSHEEMVAEMDRLRLQDANHGGENKQVAPALSRASDMQYSGIRKEEPTGSSAKAPVNGEAYINELGQLVRYSNHPVDTLKKPAEVENMSYAACSATNVMPLRHLPSSPAVPKILPGNIPLKKSAIVVRADPPPGIAGVARDVSTSSKSTEISLLDLGEPGYRAVDHGRSAEHLWGANRFVYEYLVERDPIFERLAGLRADGWENKLGDTVFKNARLMADNTTSDGEEKVFQMMKDIAEELQAFAGIYTPTIAKKRSIRVLDICMAPGGYSAVAMKYDSESHVYGITLPVQIGGHSVVKEMQTKMKQIYYCDLTMLASEFSNESIPREHPDYKNFRDGRPYYGLSFDLVFCDGNVLRTHERPEYRKEREDEKVRLDCSQLILMMQRIKSGGTMVMLLHKIDFWHPAYLIHQFSKFSQVSVYKPERAYKTKGSFYLIAKNIQPQHPAAQDALKEWRRMWDAATFGGKGAVGNLPLNRDKAFVRKVLDEFGDTLVKMARPVWQLQADALKDSSYAGGRGWD